MVLARKQYERDARVRPVQKCAPRATIRCPRRPDRVGECILNGHKHAIEAFTDSLAQQLVELGVMVNVIEPGNYNSEIVKNAIKRA